MNAAGSEIDGVWRALADPTRRLILDCLVEGAATTGGLAERFTPRIVRTTVMKHLDVLEAARLIRVERKGRTRLNHLEREPLQTAMAWLEHRVTGHRADLVLL